MMGMWDKGTLGSKCISLCVDLTSYKESKMQYMNVLDSI